MKYVNYLVIFAICSFGLTGCLAGSGKQVVFTCDDSVRSSDIEKQISIIAEAHQFFLVTSEKGNLIFNSDIEYSPSLYAVIGQSRSSEVILGVSILRGPGTEDKLPPEVLDVFENIVREVNTRLLKSCSLRQSN
jgi:hypothetical protein